MESREAFSLYYKRVIYILIPGTTEIAFSYKDIESKLPGVDLRFIYESRIKNLASEEKFDKFLHAISKEIDTPDETLCLILESDIPMRVSKLLCRIIRDILETRVLYLCNTKDTYNDSRRVFDYSVLNDLNTLRNIVENG